MLQSKKKRIIRVNTGIRKCKLCAGLNIPDSTGSAPGFGNLDSPIFIIGQSLHRIHPEYLVQLPFVNPPGMANSGNLIFEALQKSGHHLWDFFITNVLHCHPPGNQASTAEEKKNCRGWLLKELRIIKPRLILCLGSDAMKAIMRGTYILPEPEKFTITFSSGRKKKYQVMGVRHPAYFLHKPSKEGRRKWIENVAGIFEKYGE